MKLGILLKELRGARSLRRVERECGVSNTYLSHLEKGRDCRSGRPFNPSPHTLRKLSNYYNYSYVEFMIKAGYLTKKDINN